MHLPNSTTALVLGMLGFAQAHTLLKYVYVNGKSEGMGTCLRTERTGNNKPVEDVASDDMACGFDGTKGVSRVCSANPGDDLTFEWYHQNSPQWPELYLADGHNGPCSFMMKKVDSAVNDTAAGGGWFRIAYEGYNNETGKWCTQKVAADGRLTVKIPEDLAGGSYLIRPELVALHNTSGVWGAPQLYISCFQVFLNSAGTAIPKDTVAIPGNDYAVPGSKAMMWNLWEGDQSLYPNYGPPTYVSSGKVDPNAQPTLKQTEGLKKEGCLMETHNFCAVEVPKYSDSDKCWKSTTACWDQNEVCWKSTPLDNTPCRNWATKCEGIASSCRSADNNGNVDGPPDFGKIVETEKPPTISDRPNRIGASGDTTSTTGGTTSKSGGSSSPGNVAVPFGASDSDSSSSSADASSAPSSAADSYGSAPTNKAEAASSSSSSAESSKADSSDVTKSSSSADSIVTGGSDYGSPSSDAESPDSKSETSKTEAASPTTSGPSNAHGTSICTETATEVITDVVVETVTVTAEPKPKAYRARRRHVGRVHY